MRILVIVNVFHPDRGGGASVFSDLCYGLAERDHDVTVYTSYPYYPEWKNKSQLSLWKVRQETIQGVTVCRHGLYMPKNPSKLFSRGLYELSFAASLMRSLFQRRRFDVVMVFCPLAGAVAYASIRKLVRREPLWLNVQDIPADAAAASGISRIEFINRAGSAIQSWLFNQASVWSSIAPAMVKRLEGIRKKEQPIHYCPNFLNSSIAATISEYDLEQKVGRQIQSPFKLLYAGNIGKKQGLLDFCKVLAQTKLDFRFQICGNGGEASEIQQWIENSKDIRFQFGDFLEERDFVAALINTDLFVITEKAGAGASFMPSKLIPCIATATPVSCICDRDGPLGMEVTEYRIGACLPWSQIDELSEYFHALIDDVERFANLQRNAIERSDFYTRSSVIGKVEVEMERMVSSRD